MCFNVFSPLDIILTTWSKKVNTLPLSQQQKQQKKNKLDQVLRGGGIKLIRLVYIFLRR